MVHNMLTTCFQSLATDMVHNMSTICFQSLATDMVHNMLTICFQSLATDMVHNMLTICFQSLATDMVHNMSTTCFQSLATDMVHNMLTICFQSLATDMVHNMSTTCFQYLATNVIDNMYPEVESIIMSDPDSRQEVATVYLNALADVMEASKPTTVIPEYIHDEELETNIDQLPQSPEERDFWQNYNIEHATYYREQEKIKVGVL